MISMTVSIYFGMNDIMVNRYPYDTDISITGVGEEECQTAILDIQQITEYFQCSVCLMCKNTFCKDFTKLNTFLVKAVDIP